MHKVIPLFFKDTVLFKGQKWECYEFIEKKYGNGLAAILCLVIPVKP